VRGDRVQQGIDTVESDARPHNDRTARAVAVAVACANTDARANTNTGTDDLCRHIE